MTQRKLHEFFDGILFNLICFRVANVLKMTRIFYPKLSTKVVCREFPEITVLNCSGMGVST